MPPKKQQQLQQSKPLLTDTMTLNRQSLDSAQLATFKSALELKVKELFSLENEDFLK
jgi:hypothetical protein